MSSRRTISNTFTVTTMDEPIAGPRGKTGRFYYYAQEWANSSYPLYIVTDAQAPYFLCNNNYWVFNPDENYPNGISMSAMGAPSSNNSKWQLMTNDFKYIITQAIFGKYAQFGSFVINGDWMICTNGTINGTAYNTTDINNPSMYNGAAAYTWFDPAYPWSSINSTHSVDGKQWSGYNFVPNFAINGLTGDTYQNNAHIKGRIEATSGSIGGFIIDPDRLYNSNWNAGVDISYDNKTVKIGKNAQGELNTEKAIIRAENTKSNTNGYNTALYLNAQNATYNYAFYGNGNGVLNGLMFGYRIQELTIPAGSSDVHASDIVLEQGSTVIIKGSHTSGHVMIGLPKFSAVLKSLGISNTTTPFAIEISILSNSSYAFVTLHTRSFATGNTFASAEYPIWTGFDNQTFSTTSMQLATGDYVKFLLTYTYTTIGSVTGWYYRAYMLFGNN